MNALLALKKPIVAMVHFLPLPGSSGYDPKGGESPTFSGRAVAALAKDPNVIAKRGKPWVVAELAQEYGFTDVDGSQPVSMRRPEKVG